MTPSWVDSGLTGITDADSSCLAGTTSYCRASGMTAGAWTKVNNADNAEAVYYQANTICFYRLGALWCASQMGGTPLTARLIGIMLKPLEVINMAVDFTSTQMFFILPNGILTALTSTISCTDCYTSASGVISRLSAFNTSSVDAYNDVVSINGTTNSLDYLPMTIRSDVRANREDATATVKTQSGEPLVGASVRRTAPDVPGTLGSGSTKSTSDSNGEIAMSLSTGPVAFTVQNGTVKLQTLLPPSKGYKATYKISGGCRITGTSLQTPNRKATCRLVMTQTRTVKKTTKRLTKTVIISIK